MQLTGALLSEAIEISPDLVPAIAGRCGRFPSAADGGCTWFGLFGDTNAPTEGSDWHELFENDKPTDWQVFFQPGGLEPAAENLAYLMQTPVTLQLAPPTRSGWPRGAPTTSGWPGPAMPTGSSATYTPNTAPIPSGAAVFRGSFKKSFHVKKGLLVGARAADPGRAGFRPQPVLADRQPDHAGRLSVLEEVVVEDIGLEMHVTRFLKPKLYQTATPALRFAAVGDPSGVAKGNFLEEDSFDVLQRLGIPGFPAPTNNIDPRILAVETLLLQQRDGGPALVIDEDKCPMLVQALSRATASPRPRPAPSSRCPTRSTRGPTSPTACSTSAWWSTPAWCNFIAKRIRPKLKTVPKVKVSARRLDVSRHSGVLSA